MRWTALAWIVTTALAPAAWAETPASPSPAEPASAATAEATPPATPAASERKRPAPRRLRLDPWVDPYGKVPLPGIDIPRFEESVIVQGKPMDSVSLTARMNWFLGGEEFDGMRGAVPMAGSAPTLESTYPFRPRPAPAVDVKPLIEWLASKLDR